MNKGGVILRRVFPLLMYAYLAACSGGGEAEFSLPISYSGSLLPMELRTDNVESLAVSMASSRSGVNQVTRSADKTSTPVNSSVIQTIYQSVMFSFNDTHTRTEAGARVLVPGTTTEHGICGGTKTESVSIDLLTFDYTLTVTYSNYCDGEYIFQGTVNATGHYDPFNYVLDMVMLSDEVVAKDVLSGDVYQIRNYYVKAVKDEDSSGNLESLTIHIYTTEYYHPVYGVASINTPVTLYYTAASDYPVSGELEIISPSAVSDYDKVKIVVPGSVEHNIRFDYDILVDLANDGNSDYESEPLVYGYW